MATPRTKVGQLLVERGLISLEQLQRALSEQKRTGEFLGTVLARQGAVSIAQLGELVHRLEKGLPQLFHAVSARFARCAGFRDVTTVLGKPRGRRRRCGLLFRETVRLGGRLFAGGSVSVHVDYLTRPPRRRLVACGEQGTITWDGIAQTLTLALAGQPERCERSAQEHDELYRAQAAAFLAACDGRPTVQLATAEDGVKALAVCDAARRASRERQAVRVEEP